MNINTQLNCIIIDDHELDRLMTFSFVKKFPFLNICGVFSSAIEALATIENTPIDVLFSDINMPEMNGLELRNRLKNIPVCIFITSFPDYAAKSFDVVAFDFLVKPIKAERFENCMNRIQQYFEIKQKADLFEHSLGGHTVFIKDGHQQIKVSLHEIIYLEGLKDYTRIVTTTKKHSVLSSIGNLLLESTFQSFLRIHKSFAVQPNYIDRITTQQVYIQDFILPIGRSYKNVLANFK